MNLTTESTLWEQFYKNMASNKFNPYQYRRIKRKRHSGRGLHGRFRNSYMIPVNPNAVDVNKNVIKSTMVSPVAAAEERAMSEMKDLKKEEKPHVKVKNIIKDKRKKKKLKTKKSNKGSTSRLNKKEKLKRKFDKNYYDNAWNQYRVKRKR